MDWGGHVHPSFSRGRFSNFLKSVEKTWGVDFHLLGTFGCAALVAEKENGCDIDTWKFERGLEFQFQIISFPSS